MPLRLKRLDLHGYKTFATKSEFLFGAGISAVVGPNGSGKSNIVDGIRWVLGEQSYGLLRGKRTEDMIFAGSEQRPRAGMAEATLTFDNADGWLPIDFAEVSLTRRAYRDGENEYLLNGQRVRLRDISELLAQCGLAQRTYTIIGQGLIDTALSLKAEERRALFEEAAGIGVYRHKREDALRKLEATQRNLDRVLDILTELKPRLRSLEKQSQRAREYNVVKADLNQILKGWYGYHWHRAVEAVAQAKSTAEQAAADLDIQRGRQDGLNEEVAHLRSRAAELRGELTARRAEAEALRADSETLTRELAVGDERQRSLAAQSQGALAEVKPLAEQLAEQVARLEAVRGESARLAAEAEASRQRFESAQVSLTDREARLTALRVRESEARLPAREADERLADQRARQTQLAGRLEQLSRERGELRAALAQLETSETSARVLVAEANENLNSVQAQRAEAEARLNTQTKAVRAAEAHRLDLSERVGNAQAEVERLRARHEVLEQAHAEFAGFGSGARHLLAQKFPSRGALAELLNVPAEFELAVSAALGQYLEALVVDDLTAAAAAVETLGAARGRAAFLPLRQVTAPEPLNAPEGDPDTLGVAARLLTVDESLRPVVNLLLGQVVVVRDRAAARRFLVTLGARPTGPWPAAVTLAGEVFYAAGPLVAGSEAAPNLLTYARERRDLGEELGAARARGAQVGVEREAAAEAVSAARLELEQAQAALKSAHDTERKTTVSRDSTALEAERVSHNAQFQREQLAARDAETALVERELATLAAELEQLAAQRQSAAARVEAASAAVQTFLTEISPEQMAQWQTAAAVAARAAQDAAARREELERTRSAVERALAARRERVAHLEAESRAVADSVAAQRARAETVRGQLDALRQRTLPRQTELAELEARQAQVESGDTQARAALTAAERLHAQAQLDLTRRAEELDALRRRIDDDFGLVEYDYGDVGEGPTPLPLGAVVEKLERVEKLPDGLEDQLNRKRGQLRRMGLINPEAEKEYNEVKERYEFLTTQVADLETAKVQLHEVIAEMDVLMERDFRKTFDAVAEEFKETFARLFGGGSAKLLLTDPDHLTLTGVDIQCRLPGKRPQTLAMLSGGERSLTACALVFALLRVSPTPFVVLDEVDAMLDEANVGRYRDMLADLAHHTQFIVVTHNRNTVQAADTVYGITMGADSTSQVIGLKLDDEKIGPGNRA